MSFIPVLAYIIGIGVFGFTYWLLNGIIQLLMDANIHEQNVMLDFFFYCWVGILVIYLVFGGWWVIRKYNEQEYRYGGMM